MPPTEKSLQFRLRDILAIYQKVKTVNSDVLRELFEEYSSSMEPL